MTRTKTCTCRESIDYVGIAIVFLCHDGRGNIVLARRTSQARNEAGTWDIGGGALELGENVTDTVRREIREEYRADVLDIHFLGYRDVHYDHDGPPTKHWLALDFCVRVNATQVQIGEPLKFDDIGWFTLDTLPAPLYSRLPEFLRKNRGDITKILQPRK
jgi:8-oxo-dGTP diphosphatase